MAKQVKKTVRKKRRERKNIEKGQAHIQATFNNTLVTLTDMEQQKRLRKLLWSTVSRLSKSMSRDPVPVETARSEPFRQRVCRSL